MRYHNLDLELFEYVSDVAGDAFRVRVAASPAGEQRLSDAERVVLPPTLRANLQQLEAGTVPLSTLIALGQALADLLFPPQVRLFFHRSQAELADGEGLRLRLKLNSLALADLPWEYVYLSPPDGAATAGRTDGFLALQRHFSLVRYEVLGQPMGKLSPVGPPPLRVVVLLADPANSGFPALDLELEREAIAQALAPLPEVQADFYHQASVDHLEEAVTRPTHIFHFAGHGTFKEASDETAATDAGQGYLILVGEGEEAFRFPADKLALNLVGRGVRLAVLGACEAGRRDQVNVWSGIASALTQVGIPAVIGMQYRIADHNAIQFSRRLYRALAAGLPIEAAVTDGRLAIFNRSQDEAVDWGVPVLYLRVEEGTLFPAESVVRPASTGWAEVVTRARQQSERFLRELRGTVAQPGAYLPDLYVPRPAAETALQTFLDQEAPALLLVGESGMGKTSLLCHWAEQLQGAGHALFFYHCGGSLGPTLERTLTADLALPTGQALADALSRLDEMATQAGRACVFIFNAIHQFQQGAAGPEALLREIDALVGQLPGRAVRVVLSCSATTWEHLERQGETRLFWSRYFQPDAAHFLTLGRFTAQELEAAYPRYQQAYQLQTSLSVLSVAQREPLHTPLLLRLVAETYRGRAEPLSTQRLGLYRRYYEERVKRRRDQQFVEAFAAEMWAQKRRALSVDDLARHEALKGEILSEASDSSYQRLLNEGILSESMGDGMRGDTLQFTHDRLASYVLARFLLRQAGSLEEKVAQAVAVAPSFPLAWEAARTLLVMERATDHLEALARSPDVALRGLAVESLTDLHGEEPERATEVLQRLLQGSEREGQWSALLAAHAIGPAAQPLFLWAATKGSTQLRQATKTILYLIWRRDPDFPFALLNQLVQRISLGALLELGNIIEFIIDLPVTIYINHCHRTELVEQITALHYETAKNKLHVHLLNTGFLGPAFEKLLVQAVTAAWSQPLLETMLFTEVVPAAHFFALPTTERARLTRIAPALDPATDLLALRDDLRALLGSDILFFRFTAALVLTIHASQNFDRMRPLLSELFEELNGQGRLWLLLGFAVLVPTTPAAWVEALEEWTGRLISEHPAIFHREEEPGLLSRLDIPLLPLGLAYGKQGTAMPLFETLLTEAIAQGETKRLARLVEAMEAIAVYFPQPVFDLWQRTLPDIGEPTLRTALIQALGTLRLLHLDAVDSFLSRIGADEVLRRQVAAAGNLESVQRYVYWLGLHNNVFHFAQHYPRMRRAIAQQGLTLLAEAKDAQAFVVEYTLATMRLSRETDYRLSEWTKPDDGPG